MGFSGAVFAADLGEQVTSSLEARESAQQYSFDNAAIGIFFTYGKKNEMSAKDIGEAFVNELVKRGEKARYFYFETERDGSAFEFYVRHSAFGAWSPNEAASNISAVVKRAQSARKVHGH